MNRRQSRKSRSPRLEWVLAAVNTVLVALIVGIDRLSAGEMVWRLWISCLVAGVAVFFVTMFFSPLSPFRDREIAGPFKAMGVVLLLLALFCIVYGFIFSSLAVFFSLFLPPDSSLKEMAGDRAAGIPFLVRLITLYWPTVLITSVSWIRIPLSRPREMKPGDILLPMPAGTLIRAVLAIFLLAGFQAAEDATGRGILAAAGPYAALLLLALFFFPLETLLRKNASV